MQAIPPTQLSDLNSNDEEKRKLYSLIMEYIPVASANPRTPGGTTVTDLLKNCRTQLNYQQWPARVFQEALNELKRLGFVNHCPANRIINGTERSTVVWHRTVSNIDNVADLLPGIGNIYNHEPAVDSR